MTFSPPTHSFGVAAYAEPSTVPLSSRNRTQSHPSFAGGGGSLANLEKVLSELYNNDGKRYAFEQTLCFTAPRTAQQLYRNFDLTGETNKMAAWEMLIRDLTADFLDTFAPGLLAFFVVSRVLDKRHNTLTQRMIGQDGLELYGQLAKNSDTINHFYGGVEKALQQATDSDHKPALRSHIQQLVKQETTWLKQVQQQPWLKRGLFRLRKGNPADATRLDVAQQLTEKLGLPDFDVTLKAGKHTASMTVPELLDDLKSIELNLEKHPPKGHWGNHVSQLLEKTKRLSRHHMWANGFALAASLSIPFIMRKITQWVTGEDAYPGSTAIQKSFRKMGLARKDTHHSHSWHLANPHVPLPEGEMAFSANVPASPSSSNSENAINLDTPGSSSEKKARRFKWFPYLSDSLKEGNWAPAALTLGFFGVVFGAVLNNRFIGKSVAKKLNPFKWKDLVKVYQFQRGFPWTTLAQMELTFGVLCGFRLLSARNDSEWRETALRDALLGWPTLTYGFEFVQKQFAKVANRWLNHRVSQLAGMTLPKGSPILLQKSGDIRNTETITPGLIHNVTGVKGTAAKVAAKLTRQAWLGLTLVSSAISIALLSFLEPKWGIQMTTNLELKKHREQLAGKADPIFNASQKPLTNVLPSQ